MKLSIWHVLFAGSVLLPFSSYAQDASPTALNLSGADWRIHEDAVGNGAERGMPQADTSSPGWISATVPGNVQADLEAAHLLNPLGYGAGDPRLPDAVARNDWWYRKDSTVPETFAGKRLTLVFDGVDFECAVWLDGKKIGANAGMFRRFWFNVSEAVVPGRTNRLAVRIARMPEVIAPLIPRTDGQGVVNDATHFLRGIELTPKTLIVAVNASKLSSFSSRCLPTDCPHAATNCCNS